MPARQHEEGAAEVDPEHLVELREGELVDRRGVTRDAGVVEDSVEPAEARLPEAERRIDLVRNPDIGDGRDRVAAGHAHRLCGGPRTPRVPVHDDHAGPLSGEAPRRGRADRTTAAGHEHDPVLEAPHVVTG